MNGDPIVDTILLALKQGIKTEAEAISECGDLAKHQMLNWDYLRSENETLFRKVMDWCETHPPKL
jgi:hypothetical protein